MENFNKQLHDKAISDFTEIVTRYQEQLKGHLTTLELELTDELWQDFLLNRSEKIKEAAYSKLNSYQGIYAAKIDKTPVNLILSKIEAMRVNLSDAHNRTSSSSNLINLNACGIDRVINQSELDRLKVRCTTTIPDEDYKLIQAFLKAYNALNSALPNTVEVESHYFTFDNNGKMGFNFNNL